jgi:hypothetical protein
LIPIPKNKMQIVFIQLSKLLGGPNKEFYDLRRTIGLFTVIINKKYVIAYSFIIPFQTSA